MVHGPWVDLLQPILHYQNKGGQPYDSLTTTHSAPTKCKVFTLVLQNQTKIWALSPKTSLGGSCAQQTRTVSRCYGPIIIGFIILN